MYVHVHLFLKCLQSESFCLHTDIPCDVQVIHHSNRHRIPLVDPPPIPLVLPPPDRDLLGPPPIPLDLPPLDRDLLDPPPIPLVLLPLDRDLLGPPPIQRDPSKGYRPPQLMPHPNPSIL